MVHAGYWAVCAFAPKRAQSIHPPPENNGSQFMTAPTTDRPTVAVELPLSLVRLAERAAKERGQSVEAFAEYCLTVDIAGWFGVNEEDLPSLLLEADSSPCIV